MPEAQQLTLPVAGEPGIDLDRGEIEFIGNATTLIRYAGITILTDPNFLHAGDHAHLGYGLTSRRRTDPSREVEDLPPLDLCVLSHMHGDHWDHVASEKLRKDLPIVTTPHAARELRRQGFTDPRPLRTWDSLSVARGEARLRITATPGRHGPPVVHRLLPPVMGSLLEWGTDAGDVRFRMYISGDTLVFKDLLEIPRRFPGIDLALLHLGGTRVLGVLVTMDAKQGVQFLRIIRPKVALPIHYDDYEAFKSPLEDFRKAVAEAGLPDTRVDDLDHGETYPFEVPGKA